MAQTLASATAEAQEARTTGEWARAFRRVVQRRQATRAAAPFSAAIVAVAKSWLYTGGVLCHVQDRTLRILDLHHSAEDETVVDVRLLLREAVACEAARRRRWRFRFQVVHCADGLVSCLYTHPRHDVESWLVVFDVRAQSIVAAKSLESTHKLFVRNNDEYLYFGTHSGLGEDGFRRWVLTAYDIKTRKWFDQKIHIMDMVGCDIGQSICFEIIDGHFYGLSNQTSFEVDEVDWTSYYHCFCFPVGKPQPEFTRRSVRDSMWRRQHAEGPIDDRWSFMKLIKNEKDGRLQILESRKEWLGHRSSGQRAYYTTDLDLAPLKADCDRKEAKNTPVLGSSTTSSSSSGGTSNNSGNIQGTNYSYSTNGPEGSSGGRITHSTSRSRPSTYANHPPPATEPRLRDPHNTHMGDDASTALMFTFSKCPIRSYHQPSQAFLDLVNDPDPSDPTCAPRLRLRAGARHVVPAADLPRGSPAHDAGLPHEERVRHLYKHGGANRVALWPPAPEEARELGAVPRELAALGRVVSPPTHAGLCRGAWDERSLVWSTGSNPDGVQALVFAGFDSGLRLRGLRRWIGAMEEVEGKADFTATPAQQMQLAETSATSGAGTGGEGVCHHHSTEVDITITHGGNTAHAYGNVDGSLVVASSEYAQDAERGKEVAGTFCEAVAAAAASDTSDTVDGGSPRSCYSPTETAYSCSSPESTTTESQVERPQQQHQQHAVKKETSGSTTRRWAWTEPAMYREIAFGYDHLPDFTKARDDLERTRSVAAAARTR